MRINVRGIFMGVISLLVFSASGLSQTTSLWLFDETKGLYPSSVLENSSANDYPLVLGLGGAIVLGKFGNALEISGVLQLELPKGEADFGLSDPPAAPGQSAPYLTWKNAHYAALMTSGKTHLRNQIGFANVLNTKVNLGSFDWTVECWLQLLPGATGNRYIFEMGSGALLANGKTTSLYLEPATGSLVFKNDAAIWKMPAKTLLRATQWQHLALVHDRAAQTLVFYLNGKEAGRVQQAVVQALPRGEDSYFTLGRDGQWNQPLQGRIDELKFSEGKTYAKSFPLPSSQSLVNRPDYKAPALQKSLPLLFERPTNEVLQLGSRKHLFMDSAFVQSMSRLQFVVNPPAKMERVIDNINGQFRKHLTVVEDEKGVIRIYNGGVDDYLAVFTSKDGVNFEAPDLGKGAYKGFKNIAIAEPNGGTGNPFIDPNGPPEERWKYISDYHRRGVYLFTSPDGYNWTRKKTALLPFRSGTQSCTFYDDQRQRYISYHRSDIGALPNDQNVRSSSLTEIVDLNRPIEYKPLTQKDYQRAAQTIALRSPLPWYLDNGPLTPGGFGLEFPRQFDPVAEDPAETDIYVTKAQKYEWAPDTYLAFPIVYFHYEGAQKETRRVLEDAKYGRGSGPLETQVAVSRDGINWKRYHRPAYIGIGQHGGRDIKTAYIAHGMVRRGKEIWQYYFGETQYHSAVTRDNAGRGVYRVVQRLDGFVSLDSPYDTEAGLVTKPFTFTGNTLQLNIDTEAAGYAQVGFIDENGKPVEGFSVDDCVYINGDFIDGAVEWLHKGADVSALQGKTVRLVFKMRGSKLYALQFVNNPSAKTNK
jgi:hypothetical protein